MVLLSTTLIPAVQCVSLDITDPLAQFLQPFVKYVPYIWRLKCLKDIAVHLIGVVSANFWVPYWVCWVLAETTDEPQPLRAS